MPLTRPPVLPVWADTGAKTQPTNGEIQAGWPLTTVPPARQRWNWALNYVMNGVRWLTRRGIADWDATDSYEISDIVRGPDNLVYKALTTSTNLTPASNPAAWTVWGYTQTEVQGVTTRPVSLAPNPFFAVDQLALATTAVANDLPGHDHWYPLTQTASIQILSQSLQDPNIPSNARLIQNQVTAQRFGYACILESKESIKLRSRAITFRPQVRLSASQAIRCAVVEWFGTADAVISIIVGDWTSTDYTDGAAKFFVDANLTPLGTSATTPGVSVWTPLTALTVTPSAACNNLVLLVWTEQVAAQNFNFDLGEMALVPGTYTGRIAIPTFDDTMRYARRFFQKSFAYATAPAQNLGLGAGATQWQTIIAGVVAQQSPQLPLSPMLNFAGITIVTFNPAAANAQVRNLTTPADHTAVGATVISDSGFVITATGLAGTAVNQNLAVHWTASNRL